MSNDDSLPKVLIVNDDASTLLALSGLLEDPSENPKYEVFTVQSGEEALRKVLKHNFAVILLDVSMPTMDGFETAEAIHSHPRSASVPIIFVTAYYGDEFNRLKGYQKGAADYLFAPIIPKVVQAKVAVFVELNQKNLELERKTRELEAINGDLRIRRLQDLESVNAALKTEVQERKLAEERATELATRDTLTGLFNRRSLLERLKHSIIHANRRKEGLALMFLDLDKFKEINDTYGHEVGDELLKQVAEHLTSVVRESDMVARLGGDEFVILLEGFPDTSDVVKIAKKIVQTNSEPHLVGSQQFKSSATIGISFYPQDGNTAEDLLKNADLAMYHAKQKERGSIQFFHEELNANERLRNEFEQDLKHALEHNELELFYQPVISMTSGKATSLEALLYWHHPRNGLLGPSEFLSRVTQSTHISAIGEWVINAACAQVQKWKSADDTFNLPVTVNLDIQHLQSDFFQTISDSIAAHNLNPSAIEIEVAEAAVVRDFSKLKDVFQFLNEKDIKINLDSFGADFSSLSILKTLPLRKVKIAPCFMQNGKKIQGSQTATKKITEKEADNSLLAVFPEDTSLVAALHALAKALHLDVVAEGVQTQAQFDALKALGCNEYQGSLFSKPLPADELIRHLQLARVA
ncbi:MAG: GGDEF domain-containing response regulator [Gammaproteobacteria bacterium]|nr:MAG: GGDEF domain-containing response regulator [Gammaproteobacteria bacterium]